MPWNPATRISFPRLQTEWAQRFSHGDVRRVIAAEHTGLLEREILVGVENRFKDRRPKPWYENLLSATPTLELGVDIGDLSSVLLCSVPPNQASFLQRTGRAGRRDGNAMTTTLADGNSPHDLYFFSETEEMIAGDVTPPGVFLQAAEVLRRQLFAFCMDDWVASFDSTSALPEKTSQALDAMEQAKLDRFPYIFCDHVLKHEQRLFDAFISLLDKDIDDVVRGRLWDYMQGQGETDSLRTRLTKALEELVEERRTYRKRKDEIDRAKAKAEQKPQDEATRNEIDNLLRERDKMLGADQARSTPRPPQHTDGCRPDTKLRLSRGGHRAEVCPVAQARRRRRTGAGCLRHAGHPEIRASSPLGFIGVCAGEPVLCEPAARGNRPDQHDPGQDRGLALLPKLSAHAEFDHCARPAHHLPTVWGRHVVSMAGSAERCCVSGRQSPTAMTSTSASTTAPRTESRSSTSGR